MSVTPVVRQQLGASEAARFAVSAGGDLDVLGVGSRGGQRVQTRENCRNHHHPAECPSLKTTESLRRRLRRRGFAGEAAGDQADLAIVIQPQRQHDRGDEHQLDDQCAAIVRSGEVPAHVDPGRTHAGQCQSDERPERPRSKRAVERRKHMFIDRRLAETARDHGKGDDHQRSEPDDRCGHMHGGDRDTQRSFGQHRRVTVYLGQGDHADKPGRAR